MLVIPNRGTMERPVASCSLEAHRGSGKTRLGRPSLRCVAPWVGCPTTRLQRNPASIAVSQPPVPPMLYWPGPLHMPPRKRSRKAASQSLSQRFYAGNYAAIVQECVDCGRATFVDSELPFVVGALAFVGRLEEARALFSSQVRQRHSCDGVHLVAARFFLGVAYCRAGRI